MQMQKPNFSIWCHVCGPYIKYAVGWAKGIETALLGILNSNIKEAHINNDMAENVSFEFV